MTEENNKDILLPSEGAMPMPWDEKPAPPEEEPAEVVCRYVQPVEEPEEVVCRYVQPARNGADASGEDLPWYQPPKEDDSFTRLLEEMEREKGDVNVWREAAKKEKKRRRRGLWIALGCLAVLIALVAGGIAWANRDKGGDDPSNLPEDGDSASSIVDIFGPGPQTTIPRIQGDPSVRLAVNRERGPELTAAELYQKVNPSVVTVVTELSSGASVGTGVIMTPDGYIITNAHVISGGRGCWVALDTGVSMDAMLVGFDEDEDLAVLKVLDARNLPAAEFGDSENLQVGERAYAIGNPLGIELRGTLTDGIISAVNRQVEVGDCQMTMIQTTAALNNGNSGGPLINSSGQIIGINTLKMGGSGWKGEATVEGLGFALPISSVCFVVNDLIATGEFRGVPTIGISVITSMDDKGGAQVEVYSVEETMGAAKAGIQAGDIILAADGVPVSRIEDLQVVRRSHSIGDTVTLTILRNGRTMDIDVVLYSNKGK